MFTTAISAIQPVGLQQWLQVVAIIAAELLHHKTEGHQVILEVKLIFHSINFKHSDILPHDTVLDYSHDKRWTKID